MKFPKVDWKDPAASYEEVYQYRREALRRLRKKPGALTSLKEYYRSHWAELISDWGMLTNPKSEEHLRVIPFILFPRQVEYVDWVYRLWKKGKRGLGEKSREVGFTWLSGAIATCVWLFEPDSVVGFGSRKKELVDNGPDDADSIFWKVRFFIDNLPQEFLPAPLEDMEKWRKWGVIPNRKNNALIKGEIGDEIGRGGRASVYFVDEFAHLEHQDMVENALSLNCDTRIYISTVNGVGNLFYRLRHFLPNDQIFIFDWTEDPRKRLNPKIEAQDEPWYKAKSTELLPTTLASQVHRDYNAAVSNSFIPTELITEAERVRINQIMQPMRVPWSIGVDAAGMGNDEIIIWRRRGRLNLEVIPFERLDGVQLAMLIEAECKQLLKTAPIALIGIERDGPGGSCADQLKYGPFASIVQAVHTGIKLGDGQHYNLRAWLHAQAKEYLTENEVHLPEDNVFRAQATAIQYSYKGGSLLIESKDEYRARFSMGRSLSEKRAGKSPDRWDAFILSLLPPRASPIKMIETADDFLFAQNSGWRPLDTVLGY